MITVTGLELLTLRVSARTVWHVVRVTCDDGHVGLGECSDAGPALPVAWQRARRVIQDTGGLLHLAVDQLRAERLAEDDPVLGLALATVCGGLDQALCDVAARRAEMPLWQWLSGIGPRPVSRYANINRALGSRTPDDFAAVAHLAVRDGFTAVKCAPFDGLTGSDRVAQGLERVKAVREAVGPDAAVMLDAHHLVGPLEILEVADDLAALRLRWLEDVVPLDDLTGLATLAGAGIAPLAGGEFAFDVSEVKAALHSGHLAYLMPDVKHAGGIRGALYLARAAQAAGVAVSLHNPSGPIATAAGLHLAVACGPDVETEFAYGEAAWRPTTVEPAESASGAWQSVPPGCGLALRPADIAQWNPEVDDEQAA